MAVVSLDLDKEIATKIMGYYMYHYDKDVAANCYWLLVDEKFSVVAPHYTPIYRPATEQDAWQDCPPFSTNMGYSWRVVETLQDRGWCLCLTFDDYTHQWSAMFWKKTGNASFAPVAHWIVADPEPATAICKAALKAVQQA